MANITKLMLVAFAVHLTLIMTGVVALPFADMPEFFQFMVSPQDWSLSTFMSYIINDVILIIAGATIIAGTYFTRSDILVFVGLTSVVLSFGASLGELYSLIAAQTGYPEIGWIFISPIILIYIMAAIAFWRNRAS